MQCNVGGLDRAVRTAGLAVTLALGMSTRLKPRWRAAMFVLSAMEAVTVLTRYCPINQAFGINTCRERLSSYSFPDDPYYESGQYLEERLPEHFAG